MLEVPILAQPDDITCGPTSLHAVYAFYGDPIDLDRLIGEIPALEEGGTLAVFLGLHALARGYRATLYSYNLREFDPTWRALDQGELAGKLRAQLRHKPGKRFAAASTAYLSFLEAGGEMRFDELDPALLRRYLDCGSPVLCGLSATYLYDCAREFYRGGKEWVYDDVRGEPVGHFVVICGVDNDGLAHIADPYHTNPFSGDHYYHVPVDRLVAAIFLGVVTYDANLLIIEPPCAS
ncbi:C39 family peptidase [soil metagenome]